LIGTPGGTSKYDETRGSMRRVDENRTHSSLDSKDDVRRVAASKGGSAWAGIIESNPELNSVNVLSEGPSGELWIGTQRGLVAINALRRSGSHYEHDPDDPATLAGNDIISLFEDRSGLLWIGLRQGGVDKLDLSGMHDSRLSRSFVPPVALTAFMIYDNSNWNFVQGSESFDSVQISYKDRFFAMAFAALDYREPAKNRYQFLLDGYDKDWVSSGVNHYARYTDVPPGIYMFRVKGTGRDGVWNELETPLRIVITPPFWKTPWFYSLVAICAVGMIITLNRFRVRSEVKRMVELERVRAAENRKVRQRAADDFHDEFGHKLTKISLLSQVIKRNLVDGQTAHREQIDKIIQTCDELSTSMRDFLWSLSPEKDSAGDIAIRLKDFGDGIFNGTGIAFRMNGTENGIDTVQLGVDWRRHLLLIFKEAMNNAAKHSGCRNVTLDVHSNNGDLFVRLVDDGKGFDSSRAAPGQGLNGMERRAEKMGGVLRIESGNGHGTTVEFSGKVDSGPTGKS
jgi:signal transduction histidine kinase